MSNHDKIHTDVPPLRRLTYSNVATELALLSDECLAELLEEATHIGTSIGGTAVMLNVCGTSIFVKKILLTDIERLPENRMSTANLFDLPTFCQYGIGLDIGSPGFGAWRELAAHTMSSNWVLAGECSNFPLMYHWRVLPRSMSKPPTSEQLKKLEREVEYWEGSLAIRKRLEAKMEASAEVVLFLEYFPEDLNTWFGKQIAEGGSVAESACMMVESNLKATTSFMNARDLLHFDAHFRNILTNGHQLYFTDFGLATSTRFELSEVEAEFYTNHSTYDRCYIVTHLVNWLIGVLFGADNRNTIIHEYAIGIGDRTLSPVVESIITRYAPIAVVMNEFYRNFLTEARTASYPSTSELERLCAVADLI